MKVGVAAEMRSGHFLFKCMFVYEELQTSNYGEDQIKEKEVEGNIARQILVKKKSKLGRPTSRWELIWLSSWRDVLKTIIMTGVP